MERARRHTPFALPHRQRYDEAIYDEKQYDCSIHRGTKKRFHFQCLVSFRRVST